MGGSGANTKKHDDFNRVIEVALVEVIDLIISKFINHFVRNIVSSLQSA